MNAAFTRTLVLDTEALSALSRRTNRTVFSRLQIARQQNTMALFPTVILAELLTGRSSDAAIWQVTHGLTAVNTTVQIAAQAGRLRERAENVRKKKRDLTVDAIVASTAISWAPSLLITGDVDDLSLLTEDSDVKVISV